MPKKMLINASHPEECRVAVVADGMLEELDVQVFTREATLGNIYKGAITRIEPSLQAVFVDYGAKRNGFLSINDVHPSYFPESFEAGRRRPRVQDVFKRDDHVIVQVNKEERDSKGASLTTNISLAGRYLVLMPGTDMCGVSRKIEDEKERKKLKDILKQLKPEENMGFIIRTAGMGRNKTELSRDLDYLLRLWQAIEKNVGQCEAPSLLYREHDVVIRAIREHFSSDISEILVDEKEAHKKVRDFFRQVMPKYQTLVKLSQEKRPLFNKYQLEDQIEQVYRRRIKLKSGGHIVIEATEAMVTVDVNSGSATKEKGIEETAFRVNMEAAPEIARQLRLRDLGGIIVIDFIDMLQKKHKQEVEKALKSELKKDRAKTKVLRISSLGLLELSRQRLKSSLGTGEYLDCPLCDGRGKVKSPEMTALSVFRKIKSQLIKGDVCEVRATVPGKVADYLLNRMRGQLVELEKQYSARIVIELNQNIPDKEIAIEAIKEGPVDPLPADVTMVEELTVDQVVSQEVVAHPEVGAALEGDKKKSRRTGRRRRRTKRKMSLETLEPVGMSDDEDPVLVYSDTWLDQIDGSGFQERVLAALREQLGMAEPESHGPEAIENGGLVLEPVDERQTEETVDSQEVGPADAEESEESSGRDEQAPRSAGSTKDQEGSKEPTQSKKSLQSYLPFS